MNKEELKFAIIQYVSYAWIGPLPIIEVIEDDEKFTIKNDAVTIIIKKEEMANCNCDSAIVKRAAEMFVLHLHNWVCEQIGFYPIASLAEEYKGMHVMHKIGG